MSRMLPLSILSLALAFYSATARGASITYNLQSYPDLQNGYTLSGVITTDGKIGTLAASDILGWSYKITLSGLIVDQESGPAGAAAVINVSATPTTISLLPPSTISSELELSSDGIAQVFWFRNRPIDQYLAIGPANAQYWGHAADFPPGLPLPSATWIIAQSVPEPGSLTLALLAIACLGTVLWTKQRRYAANSPG